MSCIVEMKDVGFSVQNRDIIKDISCLFEDRKTTAVAGPSGCGKTTLIKLASGILIPNEGRVFFRDKDIARMNKAENLAFRREAGVVFQDSALWANQTLFQTLELPLRVHFPGMTKTERERKIKEVAFKVGYKNNLEVRPSQLSMGEQKLLAFARALICDPKLLFLDEWTESLDENATQRLINVVKNLRAQDATLILVSHDIRIIRDLADTVIIIVGGRLVQFTREQITCDEDISRYLAGDNV